MKDINKILEKNPKYTEQYIEENADVLDWYNVSLKTDFSNFSEDFIVKFRDQWYLHSFFINNSLPDKILKSLRNKIIPENIAGSFIYHRVYNFITFVQLNYFDSDDFGDFSRYQKKAEEIEEKIKWFLGDKFLHIEIMSNDSESNTTFKKIHFINENNEEESCDYLTFYVPENN